MDRPSSGMWPASEDAIFLKKIKNNIIYSIFSFICVGISESHVDDITNRAIDRVCSLSRILEPHMEYEAEYTYI
jgi:uncharacterized OsmC-like protein